MSLFARIGQNIGRFVSPLGPAKVLEIPINAPPKPLVQSVPLFNFQSTLVFRIPKGIIPEPSIAPDLLFSLTETQVRSEFDPIHSKIYAVKSCILQETGVSEDLIEMFPLVEARTSISANLFVPLGWGKVNGKAYSEQRGTPKTQSSLFTEPTTSAPRGEFKKAYRRVKTPTSISTHVMHTLTVWDLIYPILLPPLNFDFLPQFDVLFKLRPYQQTGISFLVENQSALLADEMGTGKTVMSVVALRLLFRLGKATKALILCPVSILRVWQDHLDVWANELKLTVVRGPKETRKLDWDSPAHVYLTTYDTVASDFLTVVRKKASFNCPNCGTLLSVKNRVQSRHDSLPQFECPSCNTILDNVPFKTSLVQSGILDNFDVVILDEAQYIKNPSSDRSRVVKLIKPTFRWALTGTPVENRLDDLVSIFDFVRPNYLRSEGLTPRLAADQIKPYFLRRRKKDVLKDLPDKIKQETWLELDEAQRMEYEQALRGGVKKLEGLGDQISKVHIFALLTTLKQICNFAKDQESSPKTNALLDLVETIKASDQKVLVFSQYDNYGVAKLETILKRFGVAVLKGGLSDSQRNAAVDRFKENPAISVFLSTIKTGGLGLTLTEASYVIHFDHWWNPATMWQAEDRAHRLGQKRCVNIYSLWMQKTIEEKIYQKLEEKGLLFDEVINGLSVDAIDQMISTDEWLEMLGVKTAKSTTPRDIKPRMESS